MAKNQKQDAFAARGLEARGMLSGLVCDMKWGRPVVGVARAGLPESRQG
jgi:hypothetical protein